MIWYENKSSELLASCPTLLGKEVVISSCFPFSAGGDLERYPSLPELLTATRGQVEGLGWVELHMGQPTWVTCLAAFPLLWFRQVSAHQGEPSGSSMLWMPISLVNYLKDRIQPLCSTLSFTATKPFPSHGFKVSVSCVSNGSEGKGTLCWFIFTACQTIPKFSSLKQFCLLARDCESQLGGAGLSQPGWFFLAAWRGVG